MNERKELRSQIDLFKRAPAAAEAAGVKSTPADITPDKPIPESPAATPDVDPYGGQPGAASLYRLRIVALDFETTGLAAERGDAICEVGLVAGTGDRVEVLMSELVNPDRPVSVATTRVTGIEDRHLVDAPRLSQLMPRILELMGSAPLVMHNAPFDLHFLQKAVAIAGLPALNNLAIDTLLMARFLGRSREGNSLRKAAEYYGVQCGEVHRAADDARAAALTYHALVPYLELRGVRTVGDLVRGRMAGAARLFMARPSSVLLDLASRAMETGSVLTLVYAPGRATLSIVRRVRVRAVEGERYLICWDLEVEGERTYRLDRILSLDDGQDVYVSPWAIEGELPASRPAQPFQSVS